MSDCAFCEIIAGSEPAQMVHEWKDTVAFVPLNPVTVGHVLVAPRQHVRDAVENQAITALTMGRAAELAKTYNASNILTSIGSAATQSVWHLHIHVIPRVAGDQLMVPWGTTGNPHEPHRCKGMDRLEEALRETQQQLWQANEEIVKAELARGEGRQFDNTKDAIRWLAEGRQP